MPMVRADRDADSTSLLHFEQCLHHAVHVHIALQQVRLIEIPRSIAFGGPEMHEPYAVAELRHH